MSSEMIKVIEIILWAIVVLCAISIVYLIAVHDEKDQ